MGRSWQSVYQFTGIRHVHGVYYDKYEDCIWTTTGDTNSESAIWVTRDQFANLQRITGGSQQCRAIRLLFTSDYIYFGSDAPEENNYIYRISRNTLETERLAAVGGPVYHGCQTNSGLFFSTACEPTRVGHERSAVVWHSRDGISWSVLARFKKDRLPMLFQYGQVFFGEVTSSMPGVWISPFATEYSDRSLYFSDDECETSSVFPDPHTSSPGQH
jgi:hypothetical protein